VPVPLPALLVAAAVTLVGSALQGTIGFGFGVLAVPVFTLIDPLLAPVPVLLLAFPMTAAIAWRDRHGLETATVGWALLGRLPGAALGTWLLLVADETALTVVVAGFVLGAVAIIASGLHIRRTPVTSVIAGAASATAGLVASIGGPPLALVYRSSEGPTIRASLSFVFVFGIMLSVTIRIVIGEIAETDWQVAAWLVPAMGVGLWSSRFLTGRVEGVALRAAILVVSAAAAVGVLIRTLV
jgi:uncharacterized membrane protein YfcA